ncbi:MAG: hypothetical protein AAF694_12455 [Bacteroidota bacterium]
MAVLGITLGCSSNSHKDSAFKTEEGVYQVSIDPTSDIVWQETLALKVSDLMAYIERTWKGEGRIEASIQQPYIEVREILPELENADFAVTLARKRVSDIEEILPNLRLEGLELDRIRDRLHRMDQFLMEKEITFNQLRLFVEDKHVRALPKKELERALRDLPQIALPKGGLAHEVKGLKNDLNSAKLTLSTQEELIEAYRAKLATQEVLEMEMRKVIQTQDIALAQSERYKQMLQDDIFHLELQRDLMVQEFDSIRIHLDQEKAATYLQLAEELYEEMGIVKRKKYKRELAKLALRYFRKAEPCNCLSSSQEEIYSLLEKKY